MKAIGSWHVWTNHEVRPFGIYVAVHQTYEPPVIVQVFPQGSNEVHCAAMLDAPTAGQPDLADAKWSFVGPLGGLESGPKQDFCIAYARAAAEKIAHDVRGS